MCFRNREELLMMSFVLIKGFMNFLLVVFDYLRGNFRGGVCYRTELHPPDLTASSL